MGLDPAAEGAGAQLAHYDTVGSTNEEALARARRGEAGPLWIMAERQTAGRGRRGRSWVSEPGNLYATLLVSDPAPPDRVAELSLVAALALADAVGEVAPTLGARLALKWPNDLLLDGEKLAGILIEGESVDARLVVAIGIGVNCAHHPPDTAYPATSLAAAGLAVAPARLLEALSRTLVARLAQWQRGAGFAAIRTDWLARAANRGEDIRVTVGEEEWIGRFEGIDQAGRLVLHTGDGAMRTVTAGDVWPSLASAASALPTKVSSA
jgi:BirA family transcriptional regulator, biotin operon repressor / biotin---[acetyl-CoA-carboxylase] ligase